MGLVQWKRALIYRPEISGFKSPHHSVVLKRDEYFDSLRYNQHKKKKTEEINLSLPGSNEQPSKMVAQNAKLS